MSRATGTAHPLGRCPCGEVVSADALRDRLSLAEHRLSGLCQRCQDALYLAPGGAGIHGVPVRTGAVGACSGSGGRIEEAALLPFVFVAHSGRVAWEA